MVNTIYGYRQETTNSNRSRGDRNLTLLTLFFSKGFVRMVEIIYVLQHRELCIGGGYPRVESGVSIPTLTNMKKVSEYILEHYHGNDPYLYKRLSDPEFRRVMDGLNKEGKNNLGIALRILKDIHMKSLKVLNK